MGFTGSVQTFNISAGRAGLRDRDGDTKEPELPQRHVGVTSCHVYEFDLLRSSGNAILRMYTSLNFAGREWRESIFIDVAIVIGAHRSQHDGNDSGRSGEVPAKICKGTRKLLSSRA
jgi:hypothetical protein